MKKLTFNEFEKNKTYILAVTKEQKEKRYEWLKENNYENLNGPTINDYFKCHNGCASLETFARGARSFDNVYTVEQLEWKPKLKYNVDDVVRCICEHAIWNTIVKVGQLERICEIEEKHILKDIWYYVDKRTKLFSRYFDKDYINKWVVVDKNTLTVEELKKLGFKVEVK